MSNLLEENFEDRYGSDFEQGQGASEEKVQNRKYGIKSTDSLVDKIKKIKQKEELKEEDSAPKKETENDEDDKNNKDEKISDMEDEKRIELMQHLNPRILKSKEKKQYISRLNIQEDIVKKLNEIATHKLNLYKTLIAIEEGKKEKDDFMRDLGTKGVIKGFVPFDANHSPLRSGRAIARNVPTEKQQQFNLIPRSKLTPDQQAEAERRAAHLQKRLTRGEIGPDQAMASDAEALRQAHYGLHEEVTENSESLSEENRNVMRQGRTSVVKVRIRGGKVQRRKRISAVKGYTMRGGKLKRMTAQERMRRKRSQRRAAVKRRAKQARALMRRKRSMRRRSSLGLKE